MIFLLNPQYFFILGKSFYSLSHIFIIEIIEDKINKIKWSYFQNLRQLKYENNEIPNSLRGSLSCVEILGSTKMQWNMICNDGLVYNIPNWKFGMLQTYPLKMNLALEIRVGLKIGESGSSVDLPLAPRWLPPWCGGSTEPCKTW